MVPHTRYSSPAALPPGLLTGILLGIMQSILVTLVPADVNMVFVLLIVLILLLYLLVPLFARLNITRRREPVPGARRIAGRIGMICAILVILSTIITYTLSIAGVQVTESGGFLDLRLISDSVLSLLGVVLLNGIGLLLSLAGGWLGGIAGTRWREEQQYYE